MTVLRRKMRILGDTLKYSVLSAISPELMRPWGASLYLTYRCNSRCTTCNYWQRHSSEMDTEQWKRIIDELKRFGVRGFCFLGGEPLLRRDLFELAAYANDGKTRELEITTNGILAGGENARKIAGAFQRIVFSVDGANARTYRKIRGVDQFERVIKNIGLVKALGHDNVFIAFVIQSANYLEIPEMVKLAEGLGVKLVFNHVLLEGNADFAVKDARLVSGINYEKLEELLKGAVKSKAVYMPNRYIDICFNKRHKNDKCYSPYRTLLVGPTGDVFACAGIPTPIGNMTRTPIKEIYEFSSELRRDALNLRLKECRNCVNVTRTPDFGFDYLVSRFRKRAGAFLQMKTK